VSKAALEAFYFVLGVAGTVVLFILSAIAFGWWLAIVARFAGLS
jgi:hypothetical protein